MSENEFWLIVWKSLIAGIVGVVAVVGGCVGHTDYRITEAMKAGVEPSSAYCALASNKSDAMCIAVAVSSRKE